MNLFFDLDGTLLDASERLYRLFQDLVPESTLTKRQYWELKRKKVNHQQILMKLFNYAEDRFRKFESVWLSKIESPEYLRLDIPANGTVDVLQCLAGNALYNLYIVTSRQSEKNALIQLEELKLYGYFSNILVTGQKVTKKDLICGTGYTEYDFIIGDTGHDIQTGQELKLHTIAVTYGFLSKEVLHSYKPDFMVDKIVDIVPFVSASTENFRGDFI